MLDWLSRPARTAPQTEPVLRVAGRELPLVIRRLPQARRMTLRLSRDGEEVRVSMPRWGRTAEALAFALARIDWLEQQARALPRRDGLAPGGHLPYRGQPLHIHHAPGHPRRAVPGEGIITLGGPAEGVEARLRRWVQAEARRLFNEDLAEYAPRAGRAVPALALSGAQARWGSCSARGVVRINWRLVMAPDHVRRSVVAHEVAHLVHFDHSPAFHALLADLFEGDLAAANRWLKAHGRQLYAPFG